MFPTSNVCRAMVLDKFASTHQYTVTAFCGKIDGVCVNEAGNFIASLEDPVGYTAVESSSDITGRH